MRTRLLIVVPIVLALGACAFHPLKAINAIPGVYKETPPTQTFPAPPTTPSSVKN